MSSHDSAAGSGPAGPVIKQRSREGVSRGLNGERALLVLTRDPAGRLTGRKAVLGTIARSVSGAGAAVDLVVIARHAPTETWNGNRIAWVRAPSLVRIGLSMARVLITGEGTFNEVLFDSGQVRRRVRAAAQEFGSTIAIADTLRTAAPAAATGLPLVVHLDDLLSERYRAMASAEAGERGSGVLGFYGEQLPKPLRAVARILAASLLQREARLVAARELQVASSAAAVAMTSPAEAERLAARSGRAVATLPMAVDVAPPADVSRAPCGSMIFLGSMDYPPNLEAVRWWREEVRPVLDARGGPEVTLTVVGHSGQDHRAELADGRLTFVGYVADLAEELRRHRAMVAPITSGTGMKTKVLDGMSVGLPVIATTLGVAGLEVRDGHEALVADTPHKFAEHVLLVRDNPASAAAVGAAGRRLLASTWSSKALLDSWTSLLQEVVASRHRGDQSDA